MRNREEFLSYFLMIRTKEGELWECELTIEGPRFHDALLMTWEGKK